jgi:hypothetical protein
MWSLLGEVWLFWFLALSIGGALLCPSPIGWPINDFAIGAFGMKPRFMDKD